MYFFLNFKFITSSRGRRRKRNLGKRPGQTVMRDMTVLVERVVEITNFLNLIWEGHTFPSVFREYGQGQLILDQMEEAWEVEGYTGIVLEFYQQLGSANPNEGFGAYTFTF